MKKFKSLFSVILVLALALSAAGCARSGSGSEASGSDIPPTQYPSTDDDLVTPETRIVLDSAGRSVEIPYTVSSIVCVNVGALRYTCYMGAQELVVGVEDYEQEPGLSRLYNYINFDHFSSLPVIGTNGEPFPEQIIAVDPDVIIMTNFDGGKADELQAKTGIPVVLVPGSDTTMDDNAYETIRIMGEVYDKKSRADELIAYMDSVKEDLSSRTAGIAEADKPGVYVGGVSFRGTHGFDGTEAYYGPFDIINARNLANETGQAGAFNIDYEQVLTWDPDIIFLDFNGLELVNEHYASNPAYYDSLTAVKEERVYSQISFRSFASNLETALADAYYAATIIFPEEFADIDPVEKAGEIFTKLLGTNPYADLVEAGYEFRAIEIGA